MIIENAFEECKKAVRSFLRYVKKSKNDWTTYSAAKRIIRGYAISSDEYDLIIREIVTTLKL
jgi:hypothetical protein